MAEIHLPALRANDLTGFLAALGVVKLCELMFDDANVRLAWPNGASEGALLSTSVASDIDELASTLAAVAEHLRDPQLVPGVKNFPPNSPNTADTDPIRGMSFETGRRFATEVMAESEFEPWLASVLCLDDPISGTKSKRRGSLGVTPLAARGPGTVMLARTMRDLSKSCDSDSLIKALTFWERSDSIAGYLDAKAKRNAAYAASKKDADNYGVPAAAWLSMMSLPFFPLVTTSGDFGMASGWRRGELGLPVFTWPVWRSSLDTSAIAILVGSPNLVGELKGSRLRALGVLEVYRSERTVEGNNDGPMSTPERIWPRRPQK